LALVTRNVTNHQINIAVQDSEQIEAALNHENLAKAVDPVKECCLHRRAAPSDPKRPGLSHVTNNSLQSSSFRSTAATSPDRFLVSQLALIGPLEQSSRFFPEIYTVEEAIPAFKLHSYSTLEIKSTEFTKTIHYSAIYRKTPRCWIRLTLAITISIQSAQWNRTQRAIPFYKDINSLLEPFLESYDDLEQGLHLNVYLSYQQEPEAHCDASAAPIKLGTPFFQSKAYLQEITNTVRHWGCQSYHENELTHQLLNGTGPETCNCFIAYLKPRWVFEFRFICSKSQIDSLFYTLRACHLLQRARGISPFIGVVLDEDNLISAFLCEMPAHGGMFNIIHGAVQSQRPVTWERRQKWCKQIIEGVDEVHTKDIVIGCLGGSHVGRKCLVAVDAADNAVLVPHFRARFAYNILDSGVLLPEYRESASLGDQITATFKTDIFQLGLLPWRIATNQLHTQRRTPNWTLRPYTTPYLVTTSPNILKISLVAVSLKSLMKGQRPASF